jgi:hypothetical protein
MQQRRPTAGLDLTLKADIGCFSGTDEFLRRRAPSGGSMRKN